VQLDRMIYALKELPGRLASREYQLLRRMAEQGLPAVEAAAVVSRRGLDDVLVTRYLDYSLPYRTLFVHRRHTTSAGPVVDDRGLTERLLDALAMLLVRLHLEGFYWGDCSLSNTLFRRDAGALAAYVVDIETGEWHPELSDGQRRTDLEITKHNVAGGHLDLQAELGFDSDLDPIETAEDLCDRYNRLWEELLAPELIGADEEYRIQARLRRLNELGFDVEEIELTKSAEGHVLRLRPVVTEPGYHRRRLFTLTGLEAQENQACSLLNDLANFRSSLERASGRPVLESVAAHRWLAEAFEPAVAAVPPELQGKLEPVELFHEVIEHKWNASEQAGRDIGLEQAIRSYIETLLPSAPEERTLIEEH
jgi:hypothetical protein